MATTQAQAVETERKLRPLYDAVDNGHNKKAVQIADKILKKQGDLHCAKTLKAIALLRMGRHEESMGLITEVRATHPGDQATLQACTMYFRETGDFKRITELYADAAKHYPKNQEILTHLFMAYVRVGDYQRQQQTAAALHKTFPESGPYYCWRVMSVLMQAHEAIETDSASLVANMYLPLAEKLIEKYFAENKVEAEAEVRLFLMVLDRRENTKRKLEVLSGYAGNRLKNVEERDSMIIDCLIKLGRLDEAAKMLHKMILGNRDHWLYTKTYIRCQVQRCQNFRERVRQQVERDRQNRQQQGATENGTSSGSENSTNGDDNEERSRHSEIEEEGESKDKGSRDSGGGDVEAAGGGRGEGKSDGGVGSPGEQGNGKGSEEEQEEERSGGGGGSDNDRGEGDDGDEEDSEEEEEGSEADAKEITVGMEDILQPLTEARDLMEQLAAEEQRKSMDRVPGDHVLRGPLMGRMELVKQIIVCGLEDMGLEHIQPHILLLDYLLLFGSKSCVFEDLRLFLDSFPDEEVDEALQTFEQMVADDPVDFDCEDIDIRENVARMRRHSNLLQLRRYTGYHAELDAQGKQELVDICRHFYRHGLKLSRNQVNTLNKPCDFYIVLATHLKIELYQETDDVSHLWEAVFMLEYARSNGTNAQFMLLLMKLYGHLGATECITVLFQSLNIKHLQMDSLGYIPMRYMQSMGTFEYALQLYRSVLRFFFGASKEISEYIIQGYRNGMFHKIVEFVNLRDRLAHSMTFASVMIDMNYMEMIVSVNSCQDAKTFFHRDWFSSLPFTCASLRDYCAKLMDSRDLTVFDDWDPNHSRLNEIEAKISFDFECLWVRVRLSLIRCLRQAQFITVATDEASATTTPSTGLANYSERLEDYIKSLELLSQHVGTRMLRQQRSRTLLPVQAPPPCLGFTFLQEQHGNILKRMMLAVEQVGKGATSIEERLKDVLKHLETTKSRIAIVPEELREALQKISSREEGDQISIDGLQHPFDIMTKTKMDLERYVLLVQTLSHLLLLSLACVEMVCPSASAGGSKKKRKKNRKVNQLLISELKSFIQELKSQLTTLYHQFAPLPAPPEDDEQLREKLNRLYIGASSVTHKQKSPSSGTAGAAAIGDISSHAQQVQSLVATAMTEAGLPSQSSMMMMGGGGGIGGEGEGEGEGEEGGGACVCTAASHEGGEEMEGGGVPHYHTTTVTTGGNAGTVAPNDMHFERTVVSKVMGQVLESYNMSFRDVLKLVVTKMDMADALVKQLGGTDPTPSTSS